MTYAAMLLLACLMDIAFGWPDGLYQRVGHPVTWVGGLIASLEKRTNRGNEWHRLIAGALTTILVVAVSGSLALMVQVALPEGWIGIVIGGVIAWPFLALKSMHDHVAAVAAPLNSGDTESARQAVSMIVGRKPDLLDEAGIARSALESLAENTSDGIVAPVFWGVVAGLPGLVAYKAINTLDSMIGHRNDRYEQFGKITARLDDIVNLIPARLTGLLFVLVSSRKRESLSVMLRDAGAHRSPNAGWPEGAMAGALNVRLSGPRVYEHYVADEPWLNPGAPDPTSADVCRGLNLYRRAMLTMIVGLLALAGAGFWL